MKYKVLLMCGHTQKPMEQLQMEQRIQDWEHAQSTQIKLAKRFPCGALYLNFDAEVREIQRDLQETKHAATQLSTQDWSYKLYKIKVMTILQKYNPVKTQQFNQ